MNEHRPRNQRLDELLADESLFGLTDDEHDELDRLMTGSGVDAESFDRVAAIVSSTYHTKSSTPLPDGLRQRILDSFPGNRSTSAIASPAPLQASRAETDESPARHGRMNRREMAGWSIAAVSIVGLIMDRLSLIPVSRTPRSPEDLRAALLRREPDIVEAPWKMTDDPSARGALGDVVWSSRAQQGFLRIKGLTKNETYVHQYQLWIFDTKQDARYPIDGGTFNIETRDSITVIPFSPRVPVVQPTMFAVTIEKRGGVVVSTRDRLLLVAEIVSKTV